jgi:hypothetical protein
METSIVQTCESNMVESGLTPDKLKEILLNRIDQYNSICEEVEEMYEAYKEQMNFKAKGEPVVTETNHAALRTILTAITMGTGNVNNYFKTLTFVGLRPAQAAVVSTTTPPQAIKIDDTIKAVPSPTLPSQMSTVKHPAPVTSVQPTASAPQVATMSNLVQISNPPVQIPGPSKAQFPFSSATDALKPSKLQMVQQGLGPVLSQQPSQLTQQQSYQMLHPQLSQMHVQGQGPSISMQQVSQSRPQMINPGIRQQQQMQNTRMIPGQFTGMQMSTPSMSQQNIQLPSHAARMGAMQSSQLQGNFEVLKPNLLLSGLQYPHLGSSIQQVQQVQMNAKQHQFQQFQQGITPQQQLYLQSQLLAKQQQQQQQQQQQGRLQ